MLRSVSRFLAGAALVAAIPAISQAQTLSCYKLGAVTTNATCSVISDLTLVTVAAMNITEPASPDFDINSVTAAQWIDIIGGTAVRVQPSGPFGVDIAANAAGFAVNIEGSVVDGGNGGSRASTDYEYEFTTNPTCSGNGAPIPASAAAATGLPNTSGVHTRNLCLYAVLDGTDANSIVPDTYTLTVTLAITAP